MSRLPNQPPHSQADIEKAQEILKNTRIPYPFQLPCYDRIWAKAVIREDFEYRRAKFLHEQAKIAS